MSAYLGEFAASLYRRRWIKEQEEQTRRDRASGLFELSIQRSLELEARIAYRLSLARLKRELGTNLAENNIRIDRTPVE